MPNLDKTGPTGQGPTGMKRGGCGDKATCPTARRGVGSGRGLGRNRIQTLEEEEQFLLERLEAVRAAKASQQ